MTKLTNTVSYFSHDANASQKRTCKLLTRLWGNDGACAWWRLLELLASEEGHYIEYTGSKKEWLIGELHLCEPLTDVTPEKLAEIDKKADAIIEKLAEIEAIDKELWDKQKIIWSGNFLKRVVDVYKNRRRELPCRPTSNLQGTYDKLGLTYEQPIVGEIDNNGSKPKNYKGKYSRLNKKGEENGS